MQELRPTDKCECGLVVAYGEIFHRDSPAHKRALAAREPLERQDRLAGCSGRSVQALEAGWPKGGPPWRSTYMLAMERARQEAFDQDEGRVVAFLEGVLVGQNWE